MYDKHVRYFFFLFIVGWVAGIIFGVTHVEITWLIAAAGTAAILLTWQRMRVPVITAMVCLVFLGFVWGGAQASPGSACLPQSPFTGTVASVRSVEGSQVTYVVHDETGCAVLVYATRFPLFQEGERVLVAGSVQAVSDIPAEYAGYADYLSRQGIAGTVRFSELTSQGAGSRRLPAFRQYLRAHITRTFTEPEAGIVKAMVLADRG